MDGRVQQEKQLARLNSSASVSDLSEALSDMSLSTSPGSGDVIAQEIKELPLNAPYEGHAKDMNDESSTPPAVPRKRLVVRQLSSNPYLASAEMSPSDEHPLIAGSHSYAAGESRLYHNPEDFSGRESIELYNRSNSYPLTSDCVEETDEEEEEDDEGEEQGPAVDNIGNLDNANWNGCSQRSTTGDLDDSYLGDLALKANPTEGERNKTGQKQESPTGFAKALTPNISPTAQQCFRTLNDHDNCNELLHGHNHRQEQQRTSSRHSQSSHGHSQHHQQQRHYGHTHHHHRSHQSSHQSALNQQPYNQPNYKIHAEKVETGLACSKDKRNGYSNQNNSYRNEPFIQGASASCPYSDSQVINTQQSRTSEVNAWGHFSRQHENHYKYRRSHYSSDSEDETAPHPHNSGKSHSRQTRPQFHQYFRHPVQHRVRQHSPSQHKENANKTSKAMQTPVDNSGRSHSGMKPVEFKDRFQTMKRWFSECNDGQKNLVLKGLLSLCELPQLHLLSVLMSKELHHGCPSNCEDIITWLPSDLATKVMSYLDPVSLCHASQVCKVWHQLADDQTLWRRFCCQTKWRLSRAAEHKQVISHMCQEGSIQWKNVFAERFRLRNNWLKGRCTVRTFTGHLQGISCVQFDDSRIVSGSSDKTIKVWNMRTNAPWSVQTLMGHHGTVRCLHLEGNRLVSGSCDTTIKVWDLSTQESWSSIACKVTMTGHTDTVRCLQADDDKVISGSYDKTLKIWDLRSGELRRTLKGHQASVLCVHFSETKIVSGSADKTIKLWNHEGTCMMTLCGHQDAVTCLMFDSTRVVSGSLDHNLKFWDIHSGQCLNTIDWKKAEGHTDVVRCLQADSWRVVSAADDRTIKVWNLETGERLVTLRNHTDGVTCLQFNDFIIVSGSYDKSVKLWDFSSC